MRSSLHYTICGLKVKLSSRYQGMLVDLKLQLPDGSLVCVGQPRTATAAQVYAAAADKLHLPKHCIPYWALFEIVEYNFERKVSAGGSFSAVTKRNNMIKIK